MNLIPYALVAGVICFIVGLVGGDRYANAQFAAERARLELASHERDKDQSRVADEDAVKRMIELDRQIKEDKDTIDAYEKKLAKQPGNSCALGPDDLR